MKRYYKFKNVLILSLMIIFILGTLIAFQPLFALAYFAVGGEGIPLIQVGNKFPAIELVTPEEKVYRDYLGLPDKPGFYLKDVKAEVIIVEFLNKYCYHCQQQAYLMNRIYKTIIKDPEMKGKVKMLGIGVGNNRIQLLHFRQEKRIPFPLIPDKDFVAFANIGYPEGTPFTLIVKKENGEFVVKDTHLGMIEARDVYVNNVRQILTGAAVASTRKTYKSAYQTLNPGVTEEEVKTLITKRLNIQAIKIENISRLKFKGFQQVFMLKVTKDSKLDVWFAALGSEGKICDVCHDIHFIYLFDRQGTIRDFIPIHVTKFGNKAFDEKDVEKMRKSLVEKNLAQPIQYNPETDAVTSASMTSALIFKSVKRGRKIFDKLKKEGYTQ